MATATTVPMEVYLRSSYEPDSEYVDGVIEERPMGEYDHAAWPLAILAFSCGVAPVRLVEDPKNWGDFARTWLRENQVPGPIALLVAGPSRRNPEANYRLEFLKVGEFPTDRSIGELVSGRLSSFIESDAVAR